VSIERDARIEFHEQGTLTAVTRWVSGHDEGLAEWLKNARRAYQVDRANVDEQDKVAILLFKDAAGGEPARIGLLDVGGATLEDVELWSTWQNPHASGRGSSLEEEQTQGNGGKAYMFRMFRGPARIFGVRDGKRNCKGFEGPEGSVDRGTPGFVPDVATGREVTVSSVEAELNKALMPCGADWEILPEQVRNAIKRRAAFTLVEGADPTDLYRGQIPQEDLLAKTLRHEQSTLAVQQLRVFALHNGRLLNAGKPLELPAIEPFPQVEGPFVWEIPDELPIDLGGKIQTTEGNQRPEGRLTLQTSKENMERAFKNLRPRWRISYKASAMDLIGAKPISDFAPATPGVQYIYGVVELSALAPGYVEHGRRRPKPGPLVDAVDEFVREKIREVAKRINDLKRKTLDERALDEVQRENSKLDEFKNKFLPSDEGTGGGGSGSGGGRHPRVITRVKEWGSEPEHIEMTIPSEPFRVASGVEIHLRHLLDVSVVDRTGLPVREQIKWYTSDSSVARFMSGDLLVAKGKGTAEVWAATAGRGPVLSSERVTLQVLMVDHVLLTPRKLTVKLGERSTILAEVTDDEGRRHTDVLLNWRHEADDQLIVRIGPRGTVTGTRIGRTTVLAGGRGADSSDVWSRIPVEVEVVENNELQRGGDGFPRLLLTGRDIDPETGQIRQGDPESPALWQEAVDYKNNIWWLNLQSPEALFAFNQRQDNPALWRNFHAGIVMELVVQVYMLNEYTRKGNRENSDLWVNHRRTIDTFRVIAVQPMWEHLESYVRDGTELE
jgi:hypothetical protein